MERERTAERAMKFTIEIHVAFLSVSNTIYVLDKSAVKRSRKAVHNRVQNTVTATDGFVVEDMRLTVHTYLSTSGVSIVVDIRVLRPSK